jgi:hypothetical protein
MRFDRLHVAQFETKSLAVELGGAEDVMYGDAYVM